MLGGDALHEVLVGRDADNIRHGGVPVFHVAAGEGFNGLRQRWQHRGEIARQHGEGVDQRGANLVQRLVVGCVFGQVPGLVLVHIDVDLVGHQHDFAGGFAELACFIQGRNAVRSFAQFAQQRKALRAEVGAQLALKALGQKPRRPACNVHKLANQIAVHPRHEVIGIEVNVFIARREFGRQVVAQPLGVHAQAQVLERVQAGAAAFAHLLAVVHRQKAVHKNIGRRFAAAEMQHGRPEQGVEGDDVLADEVVLLQIGLGHVGGVILTSLVQQVLQ